MSEKGALPCLMSQTQSMPSCPPVATMCCWFGCLSTQWRGTRSPDLTRNSQIVTVAESDDTCRTLGQKQTLHVVKRENLIQGENLCWRTALLPEIPHLELADRVDGQNLCCPQVGDSMDGAAVSVLWQQQCIQHKHGSHVTQQDTVHFLVRGADLTYDVIHSFVIGSEDDDPAVFPHCDDLWTAAHNAGTGSVVTRVIVSSGPLVAKRYCLKDKTIKRFHRSSIIFMSAVDNFSCTYLIILVMAENGDCSGGGCSDDSVWIQKLQVN